MRTLDTSSDDIREKAAPESGPCIIGEPALVKNVEDDGDYSTDGEEDSCELDGREEMQCEEVNEDLPPPAPDPLDDNEEAKEKPPPAPDPTVRPPPVPNLKQCYICNIGCNYCGKESALYNCGRCMSGAYRLCSKECQKKDYKRHKDECDDGFEINLSEFVAAVANVEGEMSSDDEEDGSLNEFINAESPKPTSINVDDDEDDTEQIAAIGEDDVHMFSPNYEELVATVDADINRAVHVAQSDSGSDATTTNERGLLHEFKPIRFTKILRDAGGKAHVVVGEGKLKVPSIGPNGNRSYALVHCWYTPTLKVTVISPGETVKRYKYEAYVERMERKSGEGKLVLEAKRRAENVTIPLLRRRNTAYTLPLVPARYDDNAEQFADLMDTHSVNHLSKETEQILWHQRFAHLHTAALCDLHKKVQGIPKLKKPSDLSRCSTCFICKMKKADRGKGDTRKNATMHFQGISMDWGFICMRSKDSNRAKMLQGISGQQAYLIVADHATDKLYGYCSGSKKPPIDWLNRLLHRFSPRNCQDKYARMDLGSELGRSTEVIQLLEKHGYAIEPTAPEASYQNAPGERPHQTIANMIKTMLTGSNLDYKFWPYAFDHALLLHSLVDHNGRGVPHERAGGGKPNVKRLRTFGCRVYVRPPGKRSHRLQNFCNVGIFLGYTQTLTQIRYWDLKTKRVKTAVHVKFDEGMNDLEEPTPNSKQLRISEGKPVPADEDEEGAPENLSLFVSSSPFLDLDKINMKVVCDHETFGIDIQQCIDRDRAYISNMEPGSSGSKIQRWKKWRGAYVVQVDDTPVVTAADAIEALRWAREAIDETERRTVKLVLAPDKDGINLERDGGSPLMYNEQMMSAVRAIYAVEEGESIKVDEIPTLEDVVRSISDPSSLAKNGKITRFKLKKTKEWAEWLRSEKKQLDEMEKDKMYGEPIPKPKEGTFLRQIWTYVIKNNGTKKARNCCNGSKLKGKGVKYAKHYAASVSQQGMKLFLALAAHFGYIVLAADATNAYAQSPAPDDQTYVFVDEQYRDWYRAKFGKEIPKGHVLPVLSALQGHPEAGALWADKIEGILTTLGFRSTTHETCIYRGQWKGQDVIICRQVDDFMFATAKETTARDLIAHLEQGTSTTVGIRLTSEEELVTHFNGIEIEQTRDYIRVHAESYIDKIAENHGWNRASTDRQRNEPIRPDTVRSLETATPPTSTIEAKELEAKNGFSYRAVLGEIIYAYSTCRMDLGNSVALLSKFASNPAQEHYTALKNVVLYMRDNRSDGIIFWRPEPRHDLPQGTFERRPLVEEDLQVKYPEKADQLCVYYDAAHATDLQRRRSTTGFAIVLNGAVIFYKAKWQATVATSSTEAEFIASVSAAKAIKYFRSILDELGIKQDGPTMMYGDNQAAIMMANAKKPTERSRHIDIQYFALQEWKQRGIVLLDHIAGTVNPSDALTKALGWVLHRRHCTRLMGMAGSPYTSTYGKLK